MSAGATVSMQKARREDRGETRRAEASDDWRTVKNPVHCFERNDNSVKYVVLVDGSPRSTSLHCLQPSDSLLL